MGPRWSTRGQCHNKLSSFQQQVQLMYAPNKHIKPDPTDLLDETAIYNIFVSVSKLRFGAHFCRVSSRPGKAVPSFATFDAHHTTPSVHKLTPTPTGTGSPRGAFWCILGGGCSHFFSVQFEPNHLPLEWPKLEN